MSPTLLAEAEIRDFDKSVFVQKQVVQLQIPIDDFIVVQVLKTQHDAAGVKSAQTKFLTFPIRRKFSTSDKAASNSATRHRRLGH